MDPATQHWIERIRKILLFRLKKNDGKFASLCHDKLLKEPNLTKFYSLFERAFPDFDWKVYLNRNTALPRVSGVTNRLGATLHWLSRENAHLHEYRLPPARKVKTALIDKLKWDLVFVAVFKNEAPRLKEWLDFHLYMGTQHFLLFNNESDDNYKQVLAPYIARDVVTLRDAPNQDGDVNFEAAMRRAYEEARLYLTGKSRWTLFLDLDEFVFTLNHKPLTDFLKEFIDYPGLSVSWINFGTSGIQELSETDYQTLVVTHRFPEDHFHNNHVKTFVQLEYAKSCGLHNSRYVDNLMSVDTDLHSIPDALNLFRPVSRIRMNHYWMRSEGHRERKFQRSTYSYYAGLTPEQRDRIHPDRNAVEDITILPLVTKILKKEA